MRTQISRRLVMPALTALIVMGGFFAVSSTPAMALCSNGTPHCVNPNPGPQLPKVGGAQIPSSGWHDPECGYYGNCNTTSTASRSSGLKFGRAAQVGQIYTK